MGDQEENIDRPAESFEQALPERKVKNHKNQVLQDQTCMDQTPGGVVLEMKNLVSDAAVINESGPSGIDISKMETNHGYVLFFILSFQFACTFQGGWTISECGQAALVLDKKLGWNAITEDESQRQLVNMVTIATMLGPLGIGIGSNIAGKLLPIWGSRRLVIVANMIAIVGNAIKLVENTAAILIGRLIFGLMSGVTNVCISKVINDTVPVKNQQQYGSIVNGGFAIGIWASNFVGMLVPLDDGEEGAAQRMLEDQNWRLVFGLPILFELYGILVLLFVIKHESVIDLLQKEGTSSPILLQLLKKVYTIPDSFTYEDLAIKLKGEIKVAEANPTTIIQAFKEKKHRRASCTAVIFPIFHQLTGICGILLFQTQIYLKMKRAGQFSIPVIWGVQITNIINMFAAFLYPAFQKFFRQKQALLFGHIGLTTCLFAIVVFEEVNENMLILVAVQLFICFYEYGVGCIMVIHIFETNVDSIVGLGNLALFFCVTAISIITPMLLDQIGVTGLFLFYGIGSFIGTIFILFAVRGTNYTATGPNGKTEIKQLSEKEKKELYWPEQFKSKTQNKLSAQGQQSSSDYALAKVESEPEWQKDQRENNQVV